jgi:hydroxyethylthiazole kinase-like uncharacterized protein yjeF
MYGKAEKRPEYTPYFLFTIDILHKSPWSMNIFSAEQLYQADKITCEKQQITSADLMERAADQIFQWLHSRMQGAQVPIHIFCGIGNNGGDGLALGRMLIQHGYSVKVYIANFTDKRSKCFLINYGRIKDITKDWPVLMTGAEDFPEIHQDDIIVDALFGIGLKRSITGWVKELVTYLNQQKAFKLSIDIPSGLSANEPLLDPEAVVQANHTLTFQTPKLAFFLPSSGPFVPYFEALDIGLDPEFLFSTPPLARLLIKPLVRTLYKQRQKYSHKGDYGHVLVVGGSSGKMGAVVLSARSTLRTGAGLVTAHVPQSGRLILQTAVPEVMVQADKGTENIEAVSLEIDPTTVVAGMGMGTTASSAKALEELLKTFERPMVIDADALNIISANKELLEHIPPGSILTPHPGELKRLVGEWTDDYHKISLARELATKYQLIVLIKGAHTLIIDADEILVNTTGNPGMATAGSGDVLSGMIGGLLAQGYSSREAASLGVYLHGSSGNLLTQQKGFESVMAGDIEAHIGAAFLELFREETPPQQNNEANE